MFLGISDNEKILIYSIGFVVIIIILWVVIAKIVKHIKQDKYYEKLAKEDLASLGFNEFKNDKSSKKDEPCNKDEDKPTKEEEDTEVEAKADTEAEVPAILAVNEASDASDTEADNHEDEAPIDDNQDEAIEEAIADETNDDEAESAVEMSLPKEERHEEPTEESEELQAVEESFPVNNEESEAEDKPKPRRKGRTYNGKYEIYQTADGYAYNLKASNGEVLVTSETYKTRDGVVKAINAVKRNLETGEVRIFADKRGQYKFKLISKNYRILALSSNYSVEKSAIRASESFKKFALKADLVDVELVDKDSKTATPIDVTGCEPKKDGKFVVERYGGEFSWALKASNGQILCQAEGYTSKAGCLYSIETFRRNVLDGTFKCVKDKTGNFQYKLYNSTGRICAVGESYNTKQNAESAARSVVSFYMDAQVIELKEAKEARVKK